MEVIKTDDTQFDTLLASNEKVVVKYFADWCGSCKLFAPKFRRMAADDRFSGVKFLDVNAEQNPLARGKAGVNNLPFFAVFKNGELVEGLSTTKEEMVNELLAKLN